MLDPLLTQLTLRDSEHGSYACESDPEPADPAMDLHPSQVLCTYLQHYPKISI